MLNAIKIDAKCYRFLNEKVKQDEEFLLIYKVNPWVILFYGQNLKMTKTF